MEGIQEIQKRLERMKAWKRIELRALLGVVALAVLTVFNGSAVASEMDGVQLRLADEELLESELLDVRIRIFDPGQLPKRKNASLGLSEEIREAESRYMAVHLKNTLQQTGFWGAVRVVPVESRGDELLVTGRIVDSDGEELKLEIEAVDARGQQWLGSGKFYQKKVSTERYEEISDRRLEAFQSLYNEICNDLSAYREKIAPEEIREIRLIAEMRFAEELAPQAFSGYLDEGGRKGMVALDRLPAENDPILERVRRVRERDYMLVDTIDANYDRLYHNMSYSLYTDWRKARVSEMEMIREVKRKKRNQQLAGAGLIIASIAIAASTGDSQNYNHGTVAAVGAAAAAGVGIMLEANAKEAEIDKAALEELGISFGTEVETIVVEVEGETIELTGSAEAKYEQWRSVLGRLYEVETGVDLAEGTESE